MFASEIKALLSAGWEVKPNWNTWAAYLINGLYDHTVETFFQGVFSLEPGSTLTLEDGLVQVKSYWDIDQIEEDDSNLPDSTYCEKLIELLTDSIKLRLRSDVPVGVNLSGGLDSGSLMAILDKVRGSGVKIEAFTATYDNPIYDEHIFAEELNTNADWDVHTCILNSSKVWDNLSEIMWHQEAPFGGIATVAYHNLHRIAKNRGITVLLEGQGVDEMLAGYKYFQHEYFLDQNENSQDKTAYNISKTYQDGSSFLSPNCLSEEIINYSDGSTTFRRPFKTNLANALYRDFKFTKLPRVLRMNDHLSMAFGRELREPYLDHRIVEFLFTIPSFLKIKKWAKKIFVARSYGFKFARFYPMCSKA